MSSSMGNGHKDETTKPISDRLDDIGATVHRDAEAFRASVVRSASDLLDSVNSRLRAAGVNPDALGDAARGQANEMQRYLEREIRHRPMRSVGMALALGALVGFLTAR